MMKNRDDYPGFLLCLNRLIIEAPRSKQQGIFDPFLFIFTFAYLAASYGEPTRMISFRRVRSQDSHDT
jgi:hypothetical protein